MDTTRVGSPPDPVDASIDPLQEIAELAGGLAHEIKNPLSTIRLNIELLAEDMAQSDSPRDRRALAKMELVQRECQRLQDLLDNFLTFARVHHARLAPTDLNAEIRRLVEFYAPMAREQGIELIPYLESDLPSVLLDAEQFQGALLNLVINAQQAMPDGGQLVIATKSTPTGVSLHLIDTGCGMDDKTRARIFEAFYSTKRGGSGLGLPTTRKIVEAHGGVIRCQSEPGKGTWFTIELPALKRLRSDGREPPATPIHVEPQAENVLPEGISDPRQT